MILWSSEKLEQALADGELDSWTKVKYIMVPTVLGSLSTPFYVLRPVYGERALPIYSLFAFIFNILAAYLTYCGLKRCFAANNQIDGRAFFERTVILGMPIFIKILVSAVLGSVVLLFILGHMKERMPRLFYIGPVLFSAFNPIIAFAMFTMLVNSIRRLGRLIKAQETGGSCL